MNKRKIISALTNILAIALRHRIGSIVNNNEIYASKYARDADVLIKEVQNLSLKQNWNKEDKQEIEKQTKSKLRVELEKKDFIDNKKYALIDEETHKVLSSLNLLS
ncbi:MAG: hypothetical protein AABW80_04985 [Nanoarchaeota archaeon]